MENFGRKMGIIQRYHLVTWELKNKITEFKNPINELNRN